MKMNLRPLLESLRRTRDKFIDAARMVPNITIGSACLQRTTPGTPSNRSKSSKCTKFRRVVQEMAYFFKLGNRFGSYDVMSKITVFL